MIFHGTVHTVFNLSVFNTPVDSHCSRNCRIIDQKDRFDVHVSTKVSVVILQQFVDGFKGLIHNLTCCA